MRCLARPRSVSLLLLTFLLLSPGNAFTFPALIMLVDKRSIEEQANPADATQNQAKPITNKPEIVLQAGITSPQIQIRFSPDGRLLASMGITGHTIKLWEVASGRLLRQFDSGNVSMSAFSLARAFRFSPDGRTLMVVAGGRVIRWEVDTGRELGSIVLPGAKDFYSTQLSEDGRIFAALNLTNSAVRLWDTTTGRELTSIAFDEEEHLVTQNSIQDAIALSPDGKFLATITETESFKGSRSSKGMNGTISKTLRVTLWDVASGRKAHTFTVSTSPVQIGVAENSPMTVAFTNDAAWLALREESSMKIWEVATGRELKTFPSPKITGSASDPNLIIFAGKFLFSPDRHLLATVSEGNKINLLDAASATTLHTLSGHNHAVLCISFSDDNKVLASSSFDNQIKLWDVATGSEIRTLSGTAQPVSDIAFSADGRTLSVAGQQAVSLWDMPTSGVRPTVTLPDDYGQAGQREILMRNSILSPDGKFVIAGSSSQPTAKIWEVATGRELRDVSLTQGKEFAMAAFHSDGRAVAVAEKDPLKFGNPNSQPPAAAPSNTPPQSPAATQMPDMNKVMEQMRNDPKKMQEQMKKMLEQMKKVQEAMSKGDMSAITSIGESLGLPQSANKPATIPNNLRLLDLTTGQTSQTIPLPAGLGHDTSENITLSFSPDGRILASTSGVYAPISLKDASTGQELRALKVPFSMKVYSLAWSPDSKRLASTHLERKPLPKANPNANPADTLSLDDLMIFSIKIWDAQTGAELNTFTGHTNFITSMAFSRDGRYLASGSADDTIKLWDLSTGRELRTFTRHDGTIAALTFSADGRFIISGSDDGSARLWNVQTGELLATMVSVNKGEDWLVVTPDGLFDGSPGGWKQILWRFSPNLYDVSPVEIFFNEYFHPGLLSDIFAGKNPKAAVDISQKDRRQPKLSLELADAQSAAASVATRTAKVKIKITDAPAGAEDVRLFRNGSLVKLWRGDVLKGQATSTLETTVSFVAGQNQLSAYAFNRDNVKSADATLSITGAASLKRAGTFHLLTVGVNQYANSEYNLKYAAADARDFTEEVERQQRKIAGFGQIEVTTLMDNEATKANILYALKRLAGAPDSKPPQGVPATLEKLKAAEPEDAVVVYFAGHGTAQEQRFYLIPHDLGYTGARTELDETGLKQILSQSISDLELEQAYEGIDAGYMLMVIDACNSGQALEAEEKRHGPMNSKGLAQLAYEKGMYILTAAQSYQAAMEAEQLGHGYLTYAMVEEGLKSAVADNQPKDGLVMLREWLDYATERVPRMQEAKMREGRELKHKVAFVEGEEKIDEADKRSLQRPRVFYRREIEAQPLIVARP